MRRVLRTAIALTLLLGPLPSAATAAQSTGATDVEVKAAYLFNFARFVEWPGGASDADFVMCVLGTDPFGPALERVVSGLSIRGQRVVTRRIGTTSEVSGCQLLFIASSEESDVTTILESLQRQPVLTVSDMPQFARRGGMIQFVIDASKVRFDVNVGPARDAGLVMSSDLLRVARAVRNADVRPRS